MDLETIRQKLESMSKFHQIQALRLLSNHPTVTLNKNKNGTLINMSELPADIVRELAAFVHYVTHLEVTLSSAEQQKDDYRRAFHL